MSTEQQTTRIVRSWLEEGVTALPDRVLDAVLDQVPATPQRRFIWPARRAYPMTNRVGVLLAVAAVLVVAVVGWQVLPSLSVSPGATTPRSTPSQAPSPAPSPAPSALLGFPAPGPLDGRQSMTRSGIRMSVDVSSIGWRSHTNGFKFTKDFEVAAIIFWTAAPDGVYEDPCTQAKGPPSTDPATLAEAVAMIPDTELVSGPTDVTLGGQPAKEVEFRVASQPDCQTALYLWYDEVGGRWATSTGDTMIVWIVDVDGTLVWIDAEIRDDAPAEVEEEVRTIVGSIQFE